MVAPPPEKLTPEQVFREHAPRIYNLARRMLGNDTDAEDVTQDVLLQVVRKLDTFRGDAQLTTWLHRVTVNAALALRQKRANRQKHEAGAVADEVLEDAAPTGTVKRWDVPPDEPILAAEQHELIDRAIGALPEMYRDVFVLADVQGVDNAEIGELLNLSVPAVKSRLHRARMRMRELLAPHFEAESAP